MDLGISGRKALVCAAKQGHRPRRLQGLLEPRASAAGKPLDAFLQATAAAIPAGRLGSPAELGFLWAFLCGAHAGYIVGQNLLIDGGAYPGTF